MLHFLSAVWFDDPAFHQQPPAAPINTMIGVGTGRYEGVDRYTVEFTLIDAGEPARNGKIAILIHKTAAPGTVVLSLPLTTLTGGNLQAHRSALNREEQEVLRQRLQTSYRTAIMRQVSRDSDWLISE
jgi:hypothetical protein